MTIKDYIKPIKLAFLTTWFLMWAILGNFLAYKWVHRNDEYTIVSGYLDYEQTDDYLLKSMDSSNWWEVVKKSPNPAVAMYILSVFKDPEWILIFTAESGLRTDAMNWNCYYGEKSTACRKEDRDQAWSVDCGVAQLNFSGKECPRESFDPIWNIDRAWEKYLRQGKRAWVVTWNNSHLK